MSRAGEAWTAFCHGLADLGAALEGPDFPADGVHPADGLRHLSRLAVFALQSHVELGDPDHPRFHEYDDDLVKWGGPNADNVYRRARVRPDAEYRISGSVAGVRQLIISVVEGDMQLGELGVYAECSRHDLPVGPDGAFVLHLGGEPRSGAWMPLDERAGYVLVRDYLADWERDERAELRIERLGAEGLAPPPLTDVALAARIDAARAWIDASLPFWNDYMAQRRGWLGVNSLSPPRSAPGGAADILYGGGFWELDDDHALVVDVVPPRAEYWSIQLYSSGWFESLDVANRQCSLNGHQAVIDPDGRCRIVVAHRDPEVANWLDTEGRTTGMVSYRWVWSTDAPTPTARVVPCDELSAALPATTTRVTPTERRAAIARRQAHFARRTRR